ncbi:MAG: bifunctional glutamate N-acetyltransferase/amino-acid acetyltransferase ArgJ [Pseudomonadota bacterium]
MERRDGRFYLKKSGKCVKKLTISPLAPASFPDITSVAGVSLRTGRAGYAYEGRDDVLFVQLPAGTVAAGALTQSATRSPEVDWCRAALSSSQEARALWVNAGNSNAFTGSRGKAATDGIKSLLKEGIGCAEEAIYLASTGVIGEPLPIDKAHSAVKALLTDTAPADWHAAASAIMTTDTFAKAAVRTVKGSGPAVTIAGIAKGSGMIAPDMATMLSFIFTDAVITKAELQAALSAAVGTSFNAITVDSDTSTSDTVLAFATQQGSSPDGHAFAAALAELCQDLALQIVRDGEGAQKLIEVAVTGAVSDASAKRIALSIANSPLVKTAIAGEDANWGRVVMAVGKAGEPADRDRLSVFFGGTAVARDGMRVEDYDEGPVAAHLESTRVTLVVDVGLGDGSATVWTCDLTHGYISINADYRS